MRRLDVPSTAEFGRLGETRCAVPSMCASTPPARRPTGPGGSFRPANNFALFPPRINRRRAPTRTESAQRNLHIFGVLLA